MTSFFLLILAATVSMVVIPIAVRLAPRLGLIDSPDPRKVHKNPVPRVGGCGIALGMLMPIVMLYELDPLLLSFVAGVLVLFLFGLWDDARELGHWVKFVGQGIAVAIVAFGGDMYITRFPFLDEPLPVLAGQAFTVVAMIGAINALNHSDGLDGLAGGESVLSLVAIAVLGYGAGNLIAPGIALATVGGIVGFLRYNTHPAQVFMGDSGSQVLGFSLAFLVVYLSQVAHPAMSAVAPLLLLGLPIADILMVLYKRARGGMNWFRATRNHVHHRLLDLGFTHFESVVCIYLLQSISVVAGVMLQYESDFVLLGLYLSLMVLLFGGLGLAEARGWRRGAAPSVHHEPHTAASNEQPWGLRSIVLGFISIVVPVLLVGPALWASAVPRDIGLLCALLAPVLCVLLLLPARMAGRTYPTAIRVITYVGASCAIFVLTRFPGAGGDQVLAKASFVVGLLAVAIGVFVRFLSERRFETTPTDYLLALGLVLLVAMDRAILGSGQMVRFVTCLIVLFYGFEVIFGHVKGWRLSLCVPTVVALSLLAARGMLSAA